MAAPRRARASVGAMFFVNGAVAANWVSQIPSVAAHLGLQPAALGIGLLGMAVGAVLALIASGFVVARLGSRLVTATAGLVFCAALPLPLFAPDLALLFCALFLLGAASGTMDVAMNTQAVAVERSYRRPIMSAFHGLYSIGALAGAVGSGIVAGLGVGSAGHLAGAALLLATITALAAFGLVPAPRQPVTIAGLAGSVTRTLGVLGIIAACLLLAEGSAADWSALYLRRVLGVGPALSTAGFAAFSLTMAMGRLAGDRLVRRLGAVRTLRFGAAAVIVGFGGGLLSSVPAVAIAGFACLGVGLANGIPIVFSAGGRAEPSSSAGISTVATMGYVGLIAGPPLIGFTAQITTLRLALGLIPLLTLVVLALAPTLALTREPVASGRPG